MRWNMWQIWILKRITTKSSKQASRNEEREWWNSAVSSCLLINRRSLASQKAILHNTLWLTMVVLYRRNTLRTAVPNKIRAFTSARTHTHNSGWLTDWLFILFIHTVKWCTHKHVNEDLWKSILWTNLQKKKSIIFIALRWVARVLHSFVRLVSVWCSVRADTQALINWALYCRTVTKRTIVLDL